MKGSCHPVRLSLPRIEPFDFPDKIDADGANRSRGERGCAGDRCAARACPFNRVVEHVREDLPLRLAVRGKYNHI